MTLSEYLNMLFPFFGDRKGFGATPKTKKGQGKADFVTFILGAIVEEDWETECPVLDPTSWYASKDSERSVSFFCHQCDSI